MDLQFSSFPITLITFLFFVLLALKVLKTKADKTVSLASKLPPGPWKLPLIGNLHQLLGSNLVHRTLRDLAKKHGPLMYLKLGQVPTLVVSSPESAKEVLRTHDAIFASRPVTLFSQIVLYDSKDIVFAPYGEYWRQLRKICVQEVLSPARVQSFRPIREEAMSNLVEWIASREGSAVNLTEKIKSLTFGIMALAAFGKKESKDSEEFISAVEEAVKLGAGFDPSDLFPSINFLLLINPLKSRLEKLHRTIDRILENIIKEHQKEKSEAKSCEAKEDLMDVLLKFHNNNALSLDNIKAVLLVNYFLLSSLPFTVIKIL